VTFTGK